MRLGDRLRRLLQITWYAKLVLSTASVVPVLSWLTGYDLTREIWPPAHAIAILGIAGSAVWAASTCSGRVKSTVMAAALVVCLIIILVFHQLDLSWKPAGEIRILVWSLVVVAYVVGWAVFAALAVLWLGKPALDGTQPESEPPRKRRSRKRRSKNR